MIILSFILFLKCILQKGFHQGSRGIRHHLMKLAHDFLMKMSIFFHLISWFEGMCMFLILEIIIFQSLDHQEGAIVWYLIPLPP